MGEYDRIFSQLLTKAKNGSPIRLLEIGIQHGGSLRLWEKFFGPTLEYTGIDINPKCKLLVNQARQSSDHVEPSVYIGNQTDEVLLRRVATERGHLI